MSINVLTVGCASNRREASDPPLANRTRRTCGCRAVTILSEESTIQRHGHATASASAPARHADNFIKSDDTCTDSV